MPLPRARHDSKLPPVRLAIVVWLLVGCDPATGPFRPRPSRSPGAPACSRLPALMPDAPAPQVDLDLNSDGEADYVVARPASCDGECTVLVW